MTQETDDDSQVEPPLLVVLSGPSGVGKDTVLQSMRDLGLQMHYAITVTTRERRPKEIDGFHYHFIPIERFTEFRDRDEFLEWANVYGKLYGSLKQPVKDALDRGQDVMLKIDVQGARSIRARVPDALTIFLAPPSIEWLKEHLVARKTETPEKLKERQVAAIDELASADEFDHVVVNRDNDVEAVVREIVHLIAQARPNRPYLKL